VHPDLPGQRAFSMNKTPLSQVSFPKYVIFKPKLVAHFGGWDTITVKKHTVRLLAFNPLSVVVVTSKVVADSLVDGAVVVETTVQSVRIRTALRRNGCSIAAFM